MCDDCELNFDLGDVFLHMMEKSGEYEARSIDWCEDPTVGGESLIKPEDIGNYVEFCSKYYKCYDCEMDKRYCSGCKNWCRCYSYEDHIWVDVVAHLVNWEKKEIVRDIMPYRFPRRHPSTTITEKDVSLYVLICADFYRCVICKNNPNYVSRYD